MNLANISLRFGFKMVSKILYKNNKFYCSNCYLGIIKWRPQCCFCGALFSNFEDVVLQLYRDGVVIEIEDE